MTSTPQSTVESGDTRGRRPAPKSCALQHRLHGEGGVIGLDLTGAGRDNLDYLLENIADPVPS